MSATTVEGTGVAAAVASKLRALPWWAPVAVVVAVFAVVTWSLLHQVGPRAGYDSLELQAYAEILDRHGRLPNESENYEYWLPPGVPVLAVVVKRTVDALPLPPQPFSFVPEAARRATWLVLTVAAIMLLASPRRRAIGAVLGVLAAVWGALAVLWSVKSIPWPIGNADWLGYPALSVVACTGLVAATALVGREVWPRSTFAPALTATAVALFPIVPRIGVFFHPDPWLALLTAIAIWILLRASRAGWPPWPGLAVGVVLGLSALVRPTAALVIAALGVGVFLVGRRRAVPFAAIAAVAILAIAGPWWIYQADRTGNPLQSNLDRPGYMLDRQPLSFFISFPIRDLVLHPYRDRFENELLPRFHAELWADWGKNLFAVDGPTTVQRVVASTQSVLGLGGAALVFGGLAGVGWPAVRRSLRRSPEPGDTAPVLLTTLFVLGWIAFVLTLVRYPQADGDPIKSNYLLFLAPACAVMGLAAAKAVWGRGGWSRRLLAGWLVLYSISYAGVFLGAG